MTPQQFKDAAIRLHGEDGWQSAIARALGVKHSTVWRYLNGKLPIPGPVIAAVTCWLENKGRARK